MTTHAFIESGIAATLVSLDKALEEEAARDRELGRHLLLAYEQLRAVQELVETERRLAANYERALSFSQRVRAVSPRAVAARGSK